MVEVLNRVGETRRDYLARVAIIMLEDNADFIELVKYDGAECDASCLAEDLRIEFGLEGEL